MVPAGSPPVSVVMTEHDGHREATDQTAKERAANGSTGQDQHPAQARKDSSTTWDTDQHSDAPGPFGTGDE